MINKDNILIVLSIFSVFAFLVAAVLMISDMTSPVSVPEKYMTNGSQNSITLYPDGTFIEEEYSNKKPVSYGGKYKIEGNQIIIKFDFFGVVEKFTIIEKGKLMRDTTFNATWRRVN